MTARDSEPPWAELGVDQNTRLDLAATITPHTLARELAGRAERRRAAVEADGAPLSLRGADSLPRIPLVIPETFGGERASADAVRPSRRPEYEVVGVLGEGGMGRVLLARQRALRRDVAVKVLKAEIGDEEALANLLSEAEIMGALEHPGIVPVHALGCDDAGRPVLVMKRIEGVSWRDLARDDHHAAWAMIDGSASGDRLTAHIEILMQACNALHFAHGRGVVHRDVKTENVMIGAYGEVYVVDWGIAARVAAMPEARSPEKREKTLALVGTPAFMAPEMVSGDAERIDPRTDVYLLGAALHEVLTGKPRHVGANVMQTLLAAHRSRPWAYAPEVPRELAAICNKATSADPGDRFPTAKALRHALADYLRHQGSMALSEAAATQLRELREAMAAGRGEDPRGLHRLMTECRHGFLQALRAWKENAAARAGLGQCLELMILHELERRDRDGAAALIAELLDPRADLEQRLAELDADVARQRERDERVRRIEREHDPSVGAGARLGLIAVITSISVVLATMAAWLGPGRIGHRVHVGFMVVVALTVLPLVLVTRKRFLATHLGRVAAGATVVWVVVTLGLRLVAAHFDVPVDRALVVEMVQTTGLLAATSITLPARFWWTAVVNAVAVVAALARPDLVLAIYTGGAVLVCGTLGWLGYGMLGVAETSPAREPAAP
jgi:serine/threonine-protein kinase